MPIQPASSLFNLTAQVTNPNTQQNPDGGQVAVTGARHGEVVVTEFHGKRYIKASRGNLFWGTSGVAGAKLLAPGGTTGSFVLYNPPGSGKFLEVEQLKLSGASTETDIIAGIGVEYGVQTPTGTLTGTLTTSMPLGGSGGAPNGKVYAACTIVAMTFLGGVGMTIAATTSPPAAGIVDFDGTLVVAPGCSINFVATISQTTDIIVTDIIWSEHAQ
jgi:hypothetical protein